MKNSGIEWIGEIPDRWETKTIKQLLIERIEKNSEYQTSTILSLSAKDGVTLYDGEHHAGNRPREDLSDYKVVYPNDIVANSMNILSGSVGLSSYKGCVSPVYYIYHLRSNDDIEFLHYIFQCKQFQLSLRGLGNGIMIKESGNGNLNTIRMRIPAQKLAAQVFSYCSLEEQKKIVAYLNAKLSQVDELIVNQEKQIEKLKEYKQSVITEAVTKGLDKSAPLKDSGIEWIGEIPESWGTRKIKYLFEESSARNEDLSYELLTFSGTKGLIRFSDHTDKLPSAEDLSNYKIIHKGQLCMNRMQAWHGMFIDANIVGCVSPDYAVYIPFENTNVRYYSYLFRTPSFVQQFANLSKGIGTGFNRLYTPAFFQVEATCPTKLEQDAIVAYLDDKCGKINRIISIKQEKIEKLQEYKKSLIYEYVTGKKEVA